MCARACMHAYHEHGGSVVGSVPCVRRVAGSNPTLAAKYRDLGQVLHPVACRASACYSFDTVPCNTVFGSTSE